MEGSALSVDQKARTVTRLQDDQAQCEHLSAPMPQSDELAEAAVAYERKVSALRRADRREAMELT